MAFASEKGRHGAAGVSTGFDIDNSLRFNDDDSAYLSRTPSSAGNRKTWTYSAWVKNSSMANANGGNSSSIFEAYEDDSNRVRLYFDDVGPLSFYCKLGGSITMRLLTNALYRDFSGWYHIVLAVDTTQSTNTNRVKLYVNGEQITSFSSSTYPSLNAEHAVNNTTVHNVGAGSYAGSIYAGTHFDGYLAEVHFIDGTALTPTSFGETGDYGEWKAKKVSGLTYGTNGFYLNFKGDDSIIAATGGTITTDGDYKVHTFTSDGNFIVTSASGAKVVEYLIISGGGGGGGGGGANAGGGGGAGGYLAATGTVVAVQTYPVVVGLGGAGGVYGTSISTAGTSSWNSISPAKGGAGGVGDGNGTRLRQGGGSGGGCSGVSWVTGAAGTAGQGNDGGDKGSQLTGGGGGGKSSAGGNGGSTAGAGGAGLASSITGSSVTRAGGGGGGGTTYGGSYGGGAGGSGGGGAGSMTGTGAAGTTNTGSGGGGSAGNGGGGTGGAGGSGVVIIRYKFQ
jgi:hypothetical protein